MKIRSDIEKNTRKTEIQEKQDAQVATTRNPIVSYTI